jgi:serine/threonine-protein kinase
VVYELLAGDPPFTGSNAQAVIAKILTSTPTPLHAVRPTVPARVSGAIARALEKTPTDRYESVRAFGDALKSGSTGPGPTAAVGQRFSKAWLAAATVAVIAIGTVLRSLGGGNGAATLSSDYVAIFPFDYQGDPSRAFVGSGIVELMSRAIDGVGPLRTVDPAAIRAQLAQEGQDAGDPILGRTISEEMGAGRYVVGSIVQSGADRVLITATAYDATTGEERGRANAEGHHDSLQVVVNELALQLADAFGISGVPLDLNVVATASPEALSAFLRGTVAFGEGRYSDAVDVYVEAVRTDPEFALAWFRLANAMTWSENPGIPGALDSAVRFQDRLSERDRRFTLALKAWEDGRPDDIRRHTQAILDRNPEDWGGLWEQANNEVHFGPLFGWSTDGLKERWDRILTLAPSDVEGRDHLAWTASRRDDHTTVARALREYLELSPDNDNAPAARITLAAIDGDSAAIEAELTAIASDAGGELVNTSVDLQRYYGDPHLQQRVAALAREPQHATHWRGQAAQRFGALAVAQGHLTEARQAFAEAAAINAEVDTLGAFWSDLRYALLATMPFASPPVGTLDSMRQQLATAEPPRTPGGPATAFDAAQRYALGVMAAYAGERDVALRYADDLEALPDSLMKPHPRDLARRVRGHLATAEDRPDDVIRELETLAADGHTYIEGGWFTWRAAERLLLARALEAVGRDGDALRWYETVSAGNDDAAYKAPSHFYRGEIYERLGDHERALDHYGRFLAIWRDPDPEFAPLVEDVRDRMTRLVEGR